MIKKFKGRIVFREYDGRKNEEQTNHPADRTDGPTIAGYLSHFIGRGNIGQEGVIKDLPAAITDLGQNKEKESDEHVPFLNEEKQSCEDPRDTAEDQEHAFFRSGKIGDRTEEGRHDCHDEHGGSEGKTP